MAIKINFHKKDIFEVLCWKKNIANPEPIVPPIILVNSKLCSEMRRFCCLASPLSIPIVVKAIKLISRKYQNRKDINNNFCEYNAL